LIAVCKKTYLIAGILHSQTKSGKPRFYSLSNYSKERLHGPINEYLKTSSNEEFVRLSEFNFPLDIQHVVIDSRNFLKSKQLL